MPLPLIRYSDFRSIMSNWQIVKLSSQLPVFPFRAEEVSVMNALMVSSAHRTGNVPGAILHPSWTPFCQSAGLAMHPQNCAGMDVSSWYLSPVSGQTLWSITGVYQGILAIHSFFSSLEPHVHPLYWREREINSSPRPQSTRSSWRTSQYTGGDIGGANGGQQVFTKHLLTACRFPSPGQHHFCSSFPSFSALSPCPSFVPPAPPPKPGCGVGRAPQLPSPLLSLKGAPDTLLLTLKTPWTKMEKMRMPQNDPQISLTTKATILFSFLWVSCSFSAIFWHPWMSERPAVFFIRRPGRII